MGTKIAQFIFGEKEFEDEIEQKQNTYPQLYLHIQ